VTSQSPLEENQDSDPYLQAWQALTHLVLEEGASWSGREKNCAFLNLGNGNFANVSASTAADYADDARSVAFLDWDDDGALDLVLKNRSAPRIRVLRNQAGSHGHWLRLVLRGTGKTNRDAIGTQVRLYSGDQLLGLNSVRAGDGYLSQSSRRLQFGLGDFDGPLRAVVRWPDGQSQTFSELQVDAAWQLVQGQADAQPFALQPAPEWGAQPSSPLAKLPGEARRIPLVDRLPLEHFPLPSYADQSRLVSDFSGKFLLINLWGTTCLNCYKELADFRDHAADFAAQGLVVVPLSTDEASQQELAKERIGELGHGELAGPTSETQFAALQLVFDEVLGERAPSVLPSSLLLDAQGNLCAIYQGPVSSQQLLDDVAALRGGPKGRFGSPLIDGVWLGNRARDFAGLGAAMEGLGYTELAKHYAQLGALDARMRGQ